MKIVVSHPTGNANVRAILTAFMSAGLLAGFHTTVSVAPNNKWLNLVPKKLRTKLTRRSYPISPKLIHNHGWLELARMLFPMLGFKAAVIHEKGFACLDQVCLDFDARVADSLEKEVKKHHITAVYGYEDTALQTFLQAKLLGLLCVYELPIAYWEKGKKLMEEESRRLPAWKGTLAGGILDSEEKLNRKTRELELADVVVVPGNFVASSLPDWALVKKIILAPFGSPDVDAPLMSKEISKQRLRVLFVGSLGQRKGLADLFEAVKITGTDKIELVLLGNLMDSLSFYHSQLPDFIYEKNRPHGEVLQLMRSCDLLCLPSIVEGRALVMQEAMSQGLPLLITPNTGGDDLIIEGETGWLVPMRRPELLAERLEWCVENRDKLQAMRLKARAHAANYSWEAYGIKIINGLRNGDK